MAATLITGGAGFLGFSIARSLLDYGEEVILFDNQVDRVKAELIHSNSGNIEVIKGDITDYQQVENIFKLQNFTRVIHTAAIVSAKHSLEDPLNNAQVNVIGTINLLENLRKFRDRNFDKIIEISSNEVYGELSCEPYCENHEFKPITLYGITKLTSELYADFYAKYFSLPIYSVRTSWVYGPGLPRKRPPLIYLEAALQGESNYPVHGSDHRIDNTYIDDLVDGIILLLNKKEPRYRVYNISSGKENTIGEMVRIIEKITGKKVFNIYPGLLEYAQNFPLPQCGAMDNRRAYEDLNYKPKYDLESGLTKYIEYLKDGKEL